MIDCAGLMFSVGISALEWLHPEGRGVVRQLDPDKCGLNARAGNDAQFWHCLSDRHYASWLAHPRK
jgi:hypothetical protein